MVTVQPGAILTEYSYFARIGCDKGACPPCQSQPIAQNGGRIYGIDSGACPIVP